MNATYYRLNDGLGSLEILETRVEGDKHVVDEFEEL